MLKRTPGLAGGMRARLVSGLTGFVLPHILNTALNAAFALVMLVVMSRVLDPGRYAEIVFLTAIALFIQPLDQALGRANFISLRESFLAGAAPKPAVKAALAFHALLLGIAAFIAPVWISTPDEYAPNVLFMGFGLATNYWSFSLQSTAWAVDAAPGFVRIGLLQRAAHFGALAVLWFSQSFVAFGAVALAVSLTAAILALSMLGRAIPGLITTSPFAGLDPSGMKTHFALFRTALTSTIGELALLNSPYALFAAAFGVGAAVVTFDSVIKLGRLVIMGARTLAEVALPRQSKLMADGHHRSGLLLFLAVLVLCLGGAAVPALAVLFQGPLIFQWLLGPNNVVPLGAGAPAAAILIAIGLYQPPIFLLSYANARRQIHLLTGFSLAGAGAFAAAVVIAKLPLVPALWTYSAYLGAGAVLALGLAFPLFRKPAQAS